MTYDLSKDLDRERFKKRTEALLTAQKVVEVKEYRPKRTSPQNRYLHALLGIVAMTTGNTLEDVKTEYFKKHCNSEIFVTHKTDKMLGEVEVLRSSADLDTAEMTTAIERFRNWSASEAGIYLPSPDEEAYIAAIEAEMQRHRDWL
jgi:hypothetical protein